MAQLVRLLVICTLLLSVHAAWADTTWVDPGPVSGLWEVAGSPYMVLGNVAVPPQQQLEITAGVTVYFAGHCRLTVDGALFARGTEDAPVYFTTDTLSNPQGWAGIWIFSPADSCALTYAVIEHGRAEASGDWGLGGAMLLDGATLSLNSCTIRNCRANSGHGIFARHAARLTITDSWFYNNGRDTGSGGAISCQSQTLLTLIRSVVSNNSALYGGGLSLENSVALITGSEIAKNTALVWGGGFYCRETMLTMTGSTLANNASIGGGGLDGRFNISLVMDSCLVIGNSAMRTGAQGYGGGLNLQSGEQMLTRVTFAGNQAPSAAALNCGPQTSARNCIFAFQSHGGSVQFNYPGATLRYCCFGDNAGGDFSGANTPAGLGLTTHVNLNGDSCDGFFNLFADPLFSDSTGDSFTLAPSSPCVDAGDPLLPLDPDGSISDMGMRPVFHETPASPLAAALPAHPALHPAYPNPFNPRTTLRYDLERAGVTSVRIYDLNGRMVTTLFEGRQTAGHHTLDWDAGDLPSGAYFALLCAGDLRVAQQLLLVK